MLMIALLLALLAVLIVMLATRRHIGRLGSLATLIAGAMAALWLIDSGLVQGPGGHLKATGRSRLGISNRLIEPEKLDNRILVAISAEMR